MRYAARAIAICVLLITMFKGMAQTPGLPTFTINPGASIALHAGSNNAAAYQWYRNGVAIPGATSKDYITSVAGTYTVIAYNAEGCPSSLSEGVNVVISPFTAPPDTLVDLLVTIQSTNTKAAEGDVYSYIVTANNNSVPTGTDVKVTYVLPPQITLAPQGTVGSNISYNPANHTLTWNVGKVTTNTPVTLTIPVKVLTKGSIESIVNIKGKQVDPVMANNVAQVIQQVNPLIIPNAFTPNGDGVNDTFVIPGLDTYSQNEIVIINRWGNDVYEKKNYQNDWTGNGLPEGTYFYILKVYNLAGIWDTYKGYVTLLRTKME
ncbi:MAG: T9SS type B sorting domain-containing protein [Mucilaginibacter sp.]